MKNSLYNPTIISSANTRPILKRVRRGVTGTGRAIYSVPVDDTVGRLVVSVTVQNADSAKFVSLKNPLGVEQSTNVNLSRAKVYEIDNPMPGLWKLEFGDGVGIHDYVARALSRKLIQFGFIFFHKFVRKNTLIPVSHPLLGKARFISPATLCRIERI